MDIPRTRLKAIGSTILAISIAALAACAPDQPGPTPMEPPATVPPPPPQSATDSATQRVDPEDPKAGMNNNRPDTIKETKPGTP
jgi:hypothetical protein